MYTILTNFKRTFILILILVFANQFFNGGQIKNMEYKDYYFYCPKNCGRKYKHKFNLNSHLKYECGVPKKFSCNICGRRFALKGNYKTHMAVIHRVLIG